MTVREIILFTALAVSILLNCIQFAEIRTGDAIIELQQEALRKYVGSHEGGGEDG